MGETQMCGRAAPAKRITDFLVHFFNALFIVLPLGAAVLVASRHFFAIGNKLVGALGFLLLVAFIAAVLFFVRWLQTKKLDTRLVTVLLCLGVFAVAAVVRFLPIYLFREDIAPFSDFWRSWRMAHGDTKGHLDYYTLFPAYLNFSLFERLSIAVFGDRYIFIPCLNILCSSLTASLIFLLAQAVAKNRHIAVAAGLLFALMPANIVYNAVGTPEFLTVLFNTAGLYCLVKFSAVKSGARFALAAAAGILLGIGSSFKTFAVVILLAFAMVGFAAPLSAFKRSEGKVLGKRLLAALCAVLVVFVGYRVTSSAILKNTEKTYGVKLDPGASMPHFLLVGLNTEGEGQIYIGNLSRQYYKRYLENGMDAAEAKTYALSLLRDDWKQHPDRIPALFYKKFVHAWQDDTIPVWYFNTQIGLKPDSVLEKAVYRYTNGGLEATAQLFYIMLIAFSAIGGVFYFRRCKKSGAFCYDTELLMLIVFGYFCVIMLSEAQSRYKCLITPYLCILAACGLYRFFKVIQRRLKK